MSLFSSLCIILPLADFYQRLIILPIFHAQAASKVTPPHTQDLLSFNGFWGARDGTVVRALASHQCGPGSNPGVDAICGLSLLLILSLAPRGFSPGTPVFPSPQNPTFPNSSSIRNWVDEDPLCGCATSKSSSSSSSSSFCSLVDKLIKAGQRTRPPGKVRYYLEWTMRRGRSDFVILC